MTRKLQFRRYANTSLASIIGADGELIVDKTNKTITLHDGTTAGGTRLATESFATTHGGSSNYGNSNVASFLPLYAGSINASQVIYNTDYMNLGSRVGFQIQYDPSGTYDVYDIKNGSWIYIDGGGLVWSSNVNGNYDGTYTHNTIILDNDGGISATGNIYSPNIISNNFVITGGFLQFGDGTKQYTANVPDNYARNTSNTNSNNIVVIQGVDVWQNTQITSTNNNSNSAFGVANTSSNTAIAAGSYANSAFGVANTAATNGSIAITAGSYANSAFGVANTSSSIIPQNIPQTTNYSLQLSDAGKHIYITNANQTIINIQNNGTVSWNIGSTILLVSRSTFPVIVLPQSNVTLYMANNSTSKSLANVYSYGMATLLNVAANTWFINGAGVS